MLIAHLDLDAFYAACEVLDHPEYAGRPLIVGGDPHGRGVVATASYEARRYGIHSAMSAAEALRRCPEALFVRPDFERYRARSREVWSWVQARVERVEQTGIDEGYLELAAARDDPGTARGILLGLQVGLRKTTGLGASFGCGASKTVAKIASDFRKPHGLTVVPPEQTAAFLAPLELRKLPGVGPRLERRLLGHGLRTIGELAGLSDGQLRQLLPGVVGQELRDRARGIDPRPVDPEPGEPVSQGAEETFARDLVAIGEMEAWIDRMAETVWQRLERTGLRARRVTAKIRYHDFKTVTRSQTVREPFGSLDELTGTARALLRRALEERGDPVRLLGLYLSAFSRPEGGPQGQLHLPLGDGAASGVPRST
jgi:DNA polymerase-4